MTRDVILGMKLVKFDRRAFRTKYGIDLLKLVGAEIGRLEEEGFLTVKDDAIVLSSKGILYGDYVGRILALAMESQANWRPTDVQASPDVAMPQLPPPARTFIDAASTAMPSANPAM
jgi:hypothetical protein